MKGQLLAFCLVSVVPVLAVPAPGQLFNLTNWKLQLPQASKKGGVVEISQPALATYSSPNFYTNASDMSMTFWCPINGAHTSGSGFPRSELRELFNFTTQGTHVLAVTMRVDEIPPSGSITIGQAHLDGLSGACSIFCELEWTNGEIVSHVRTQTCSSVNMKLPGTFSLGETFSYVIEVAGNVLTVSTNKGEASPYSYSWALPGPIYFKAGDYVQQAGSSATEGGAVAISALKTTHSQGMPEVSSIKQAKRGARVDTQPGRPRGPVSTG